MNNDYDTEANFYVVTVFCVLFILALAFLSLGCAPAQGPEGAKGSPGVAGPPGQAAPIPTIYSRAATLSECTAGGTVLTITSQDTTSTEILCSGTQGAQGDQGPQGTPGTVITPVSFCGGPSVYPSTFPEFGLVISGKIYGVYSANGGFLAYLPPGLYSSNAIGSSCTFTINPDATVTNN